MAKLLRMEFILSVFVGLCLKQINAREKKVLENFLWGF